MINENDTVKIKWITRNQKRYTDLGYEFTKNGDYFDVKIKNLPNSSKERINVVCDYCGKQYTVQYYNFVIGRNTYPTDACFDCRYKKAKDSHRSKNRVKHFPKIKEAAENKGFEILSTMDDYETMWTNFKLKCPKHGEFYLSGDAILHAGGCFECKNEKMHFIMLEDPDKVESIINNTNGNTLLNKEEYCGAFIKNLRIRCACGNEYTTSYSQFKASAQCCRSCGASQSKAEKYISELLDFYKIEYVQEKRFEDCRDKKPLPFDFYLPSYNMCVEYDGEGHYMEEFYTIAGNNHNQKELFERTKRHDDIKNKYCQDNGIKLLRIPYWEYDNIEDIIIKELKIKKVI